MKTTIPSNLSALLLILSQSLFISSVFAQQQESETTPEKKEKIETIEVTGERPADHYRRLMYSAEEDFYSLYNQLTDKSEFKVTCEYRSISAFSRLKKRSCEPAYLGLSQYEETQDAFNTVRKQKIMKGNIDKVSLPHHERRRAKKYREQQLEDLKKRLEESPELLAKYHALVQAKTKYEEAKEDAE